jgi:hypothetical protein
MNMTRAARGEGVRFLYFPKNRRDPLASTVKVCCDTKGQDSHLVELSRYPEQKL